MRYIEIEDPEMHPLSRDLYFTLSPKQVELVKQGKLVEAWCTGLDLRVYKALRLPNNLKKLYEVT